MPKSPLEVLKSRDPREYWYNEAAEFTPWLAENIQLLGDAIGMDLEVQSQEQSVGPFRADILCRETATDHLVLIENQIEQTDHIHLGQLLTYAAGLDAATVVWVAKRFRNEHRAALDWLNEITGVEFSFFGLEIELWQIGDSALAPKFNTVSKPNDWIKPPPPPGGLTETTQLQLDFWTAFRDFVLEQSTILKPQKPLPQGYAVFSIGKTYFALIALINIKARRVESYLQISGPNSKTFYRGLETKRAEIDSEYHGTLEWCENPEILQSHIRSEHLDCDPADMSDWGRQHRYLLDRLEGMHTAFSKRIKGLTLPDEPAE